MTRLNGGAWVSTLVLQIDGGLLEGVGTIAGDVSNGGTVGPGPSAGLLQISGKYTQEIDGTFSVEIGGNDADDNTDCDDPTCADVPGCQPTPTPTTTPTATPTPTPTPTSTPTATPTPTETPLPCAGDCNDDGRVSVNELVRGINIALGKASVDGCPLLDSNDDGVVGVDELLAAVDTALVGCP